MRLITITRQLDAASANAICLSQTPGGAGALTLNGGAVSGGVAVLDAQRKVLFTFAANETGHSFELAGTDDQGRVISETIAGTTAGTVSSLLDYKTVTSITIDAAATGAMTVGTSGVGASQWIPLDKYSPSAQIAIALDITGTVNVTVQKTNDNPFDADPSDVLLAFSDTDLANETTDQFSSRADRGRAVRLLTNSGAGTCVMTVTQQGVF